MSSAETVAARAPEHASTLSEPLTQGARGYRLTSIDMLRGLVIAIMAIDHTRDYVMVGGDVDPTANPDIGAALFFTRWITHFCARVFVFLAGHHGWPTSDTAEAAMAEYLSIPSW